MLGWRSHVQHVRVLLVNEEEGTIVNSAQPYQQITNLCDWIDGRVVTVCRWIRELFQQIFVVLFLKQHDHIFK